jgi:hypothetical protein
MHFGSSYFWSLLFSTRFFEPVLIVVVIATISMLIGIAIGTRRGHHLNLSSAGAEPR